MAVSIMIWTDVQLGDLPGLPALLTCGSRVLPQAPGAPAAGNRA